MIAEGFVLIASEVSPLLLTLLTVAGVLLER